MNKQGDLPQRRIVVGISGSSAPHLGVAVLEALTHVEGIETHLIMSAGARLTVKLEMSADPSSVEAFADVVHDPGDLAAGPSSGSFSTMGMVVAPCSMKTLAAIATGISTNPLTRAADVTLKERRPLVLVPERRRST